MSNTQYKLLAIDGGGIRGVIPATILAEIEQRTGQHIADLFHLVAGTSTGGILALGLTLADPVTGKPKYSASDLAGLYSKKGGEIFKEPGWRKMLGIVDNLFDETYNHDGIEGVLEEYFGEARLSQALSQVLVTAYDMQLRGMFLFNSRLAKDPERAEEEDFLVRDVARCTSAAPTYFEPKPLDSKNHRHIMIDGGVFANNPSMLAYTEAKQLYESRTPEYQEEQGSRDMAGGPVEARIVSEPFFLLSLGTGTSQKEYDYEKVKGWGLAKWAKPVIDIMMQGVSNSVHYQMKRLLPPRFDGTDRYIRLNIPNMKSEHTAMDDASEKNLRALEKYAADFIRDYSNRIDEVCRKLGE